MAATDLSLNAPTARWFSSACSELGHVRKINEDSFLDAREQQLWAVADGMGGHSKGDRASQAIINQLQGFIATDDGRKDLDNVMARLNQANQYCREHAKSEVMGSTVAALYARGMQAFLFWAGDSRIYRLRNGELTQLTDDHSLVQELYRLGELTAAEAENHPSSNVITRAVGVHDDLDVQVRQIALQAGDRFLLCSDGLFKDVQQDELAQNLARPSPQYALDKMVQLALRRGGTDNITAIVVHLSSASLLNTKS